MLPVQLLTKPLKPQRTPWFQCSAMCYPWETGEKTKTRCVWNLNYSQKSQLGLNQHGTWKMLVYSGNTIQDTFFKQIYKRGPYSIYKYIQKLVKQPLCGYMIYTLKLDPGIHSYIRWKWRGRRGRDKNDEGKDQHHFFRKVKDLDAEKLLVRGSPMHIELKNLSLTLRSLRISSPLNCFIMIWITNSYFPLQISNIGTLFCLDTVHSQSNSLADSKITCPKWLSQLNSTAHFLPLRTVNREVGSGPKRTAESMSRNFWLTSLLPAFTWKVLDWKMWKELGLFWMLPWHVINRNFPKTNLAPTFQDLFSNIWS